MNTHSRTAASRRWLAVSALLGVSIVAPPVHAACNATSYKANPNNATIVQEYNASGGYVPMLVTLGVNKALADGVVITWSQLQGAPVTLDTTNPAAPTFLTPSVPAAGSVLRFQLEATCPDGGTAVDSTGTITIVNVNRPPLAYVSASPSTAYVGDTVTLRSTAPSGTPASSDPDGDALSYQWTQTAGSPTATLINSNSATASFVAPPAASPYSLTFRLRVTDTGGLFNIQSVVVNVTANVPPVARLVCPEFANEGERVELDGSTSGAGSGGALSYEWTQLQGSPEIVIGGETGNSVEFYAPSMTATFDGYLEFQLHVANSAGEDLATCATQIVDVTDPVITVPDDITVEATSDAGEMVTYTVLAQDAAEDNAPYELLSCEPPSGSLFHLAAAPTKSNATTVVCAASDLAGNTADADFAITVQDTTAPVITVPGSYAIDATGPDGAVANYTATTLDAVDGGGDATCAPASGDIFPLGTTPVICNASDARLNAAAPASFNLTVHDATPPVINPHPDVTAEATGPYGASVSYDSPATTDIVDGSGIASCSPASGDTFPLGETTVYCNATDEAGNDAIETSFKVFVVDTAPPVITPHGNVTKEATGPGGANVSYDYPATSDIVDGAGTASCSPLSGDNFPLGESTVYCNAADEAGNDALATSFKVFVVDTTPPVIDAHPDVTIEATSSTGAIVSYSNPGTTDIVDGAGTASCSPLSGENFPLGESAVYCNAADVAGNPAVQTSFKVFVVDTTAPVIEPHLDITAEATSSAGASVGYTSPATTDIVDGDGTATCTPASTSTFAICETTVHCDATDLAGNAAIQTAFKVLVVDTTAPVVTGPANVTKEATGPLTAVIFGTATATDAVGVTSLTDNAPELFPLGTTTITWTARDAAGNQGIATSTVTIVDTTAPSLTTPGNLVREATSAAGAAVGFTTSAVDLVSGTVAVTCSPGSGSTFALGSTTVACSAADAIGNTAHASFSVTVEDTTGPTIAPHSDVTANASGNSSALVNYTLPTASDLVDGLVPVSCLPTSGSTFNVGSTTVTCSATDAVGNHATPTTFKVIVSYTFNGFFQPIDNHAVNAAKAGSAIPVKFSLGGNQGLNIFAANSPTSQAVACDSMAPIDEIESTLTAGASTLQYDAGIGQYIYVWKTEKNWLGCRQLRVTLRDGSTRTAMFKFR